MNWFYDLTLSKKLISSVALVAAIAGVIGYADSHLSFPTQAAVVSTVQGGGEMITLRSSFDLPNAIQAPTRGLSVLASNNNR